MMLDRPASTSTLLTVASGQLFSTSLLPTAAGNIQKVFDVDSALTDTSISGAYIDEIYLCYSKLVNQFIDAQAAATGTYSQSGTTVTVTPSSTHNVRVGDVVYLDYTSGVGVDEIVTITKVTSTTFVGTSANTLTTSGNLNFYPPTDICFYASNSSTVTDVKSLYPLFVSHVNSTYSYQNYSLTLQQDLPLINHPVVQGGSQNVTSTNSSVAPKMRGLMLPRGTAVYAAVSGTTSLTNGFYIGVQAGYY
jgi:hypothetical protein